jgi:nucleoside-diphosphate-sugar epimerase
MTDEINGATVVAADLEYICTRLESELQILAGKRLLVTGGAGFLGHYLVQSLLWHNARTEPARRVRVVVYDNYLFGIPAWLSALSGDPSLELVRHDVSKPLPDDCGGFDFIIHAASIASPVFYRKYPIETMDANVNGVRHLLDHCRDQKAGGRPVQGFLFLSTSEIYGDPTPDSIPTPETYRGNVSSTGPRACYDESKRYGETLCVNFARQFGLPVRMARPFNNYGPGLKIGDGRVMADFARSVVSGSDIVMHSDGSPTRAFCYVADAIVGYYKTLIRGRDGEPYNIGVAGPEISMAALADKVAAVGRELLGYRGRVIRQASAEKDYLVDNPRRRCPVIDKARHELGYEPGVTIDEGLRRSILWYRDHRETGAQP